MERRQAAADALSAGGWPGNGGAELLLRGDLGADLAAPVHFVANLLLV